MIYICLEKYLNYEEFELLYTTYNCILLYKQC